MSDILDLNNELPAGVNKFVDAVSHHFAQTVINLRARATELHNAAIELEDKANQLEIAGPNLSKDFEGWIKFERQCHVRQQSLALVKERK